MTGRDYHENKQSGEAEVDPPAFADLAKAPVRTVDVGDWPTLENIMDKLNELGLLGEGFVYTALKTDRVEDVHQHGSYVTDESGKHIIFGCTYRRIDGEWIIAQMNNNSTYLTDYMTQNTSVGEDPVVAVYDLTQLRHHCAAEFEFVDPERREKALVALVRIQGF
ncbi:MAG: hypothetical protein KDD70_14755 [Bdellovibrionales bacterium]|nr:hypothetical protein [Bdellovibrionales bacterium]